MTQPAVFHPAVEAWFRKTFPAPTEAQARAWPAIQAGRHVLVAAPAGSGRTLAAFLAAIDALVRRGVEAALPDETCVVYVSPLKALSNDIRRNLEAPLAGIRAELAALGLRDVEIRTLVRTGDTPQSERASMRRRPPHIVVTTPESLYVLLGSDSGRKMLSTTRTVIVDEIHALAPNKRGSHLALSLERIGKDGVTAHHGSLAKERRLAAEQRLKNGELRALVATASLELGIDIGDVELVCQLGTPRSIATFLQRAGRANHTVSGQPKARLFPLSRDELVECTALLDAVRRGELDRVAIPGKPLDVLAQQIVAEVAAREWTEDD